MAEHLTPSDDFSAIVDDFVRRLRAVEREGRLNGFQADLLQTFENGQLLGDTKYINFGAGVRATLTGDRYVEVTADAGGGTSYDAIVDGTLAASDPANRLFLGIGEALTYLLNIVGLASCIVGVRPEGTSGYVETANWDSPADVRLIGLRGISEGAGGGDDTREVDWDWNGFRPTSRTNLHIENFHLWDVGAYTSPGGGLAPLTALEMVETDYNAPDSYTSGVALCSSFVGYNSTFDLALASPVTYRLSSGPCVMVQCDGDVRGAAHTFIPAGAASSLLMAANRWKGSTWTLPAAFDVELLPTLGFRGTVPGTPGSAGTFVVPAASTGRIVSHANAGVTATADFNQLVLEGQFATLTATGAHEVLSIQGENGSATFGGKVWTIKGPADINCVTRDAGRYVFQGEGVGGVIAADGLTGTTTFLDFVAADRCSLVIAADPGSGPRKAYAFDASSDRNVLVFAGHDSGWTLGTDAGTGNRVLPEGTVPFSVNGHVIEDEGTPLTQRANLNFVGIGVTVTDATPDTLVTIPGVTPGAGSSDWTDTRIPFGSATGQLTESADITFNDTTNNLAIGGDLLLTGKLVVGDAGLFSAFDYFGLAHEDCANTTDFALLQNGGGETILNAKTGTAIGLRVNNTVKVIVAAASTSLATPLYLSTPAPAAQAAAAVYAGTGAPNNANGANGDFYLNAAGGALTTIFHKRLGVWVGIL